MPRLKLLLRDSDEDEELADNESDRPKEESRVDQSVDIMTSLANILRHKR